MGSEIGEDFKAWRDHKAAKKRKNQGNSTKILDAAYVKYESKNHGNHLIVQGGELGLIDFWPSTGLFILRNTQEEGRGVRKLLKRLDDNRRGK